MNMELTFLATRELRPLSADLCLEAVWQTADELQNVRIGTRLFNLLFGNLLDRLGSAEKNVEFDRSIIQSWFLRHQSQMFSVFSDVQFRDLLIIQL